MKTTKLKKNLCLVLTALILLISGITFAQSDQSAKPLTIDKQAFFYQNQVSDLPGKHLKSWRETLVDPSQRPYHLEDSRNYSFEQPKKHELFEGIHESILHSKWWKGLSDTERQTIALELHAFPPSNKYDELERMMTYYQNKSLETNLVKREKSTTVSSPCSGYPTPNAYGDVTLSSQAEVDAFGALGCSEITGNLIIFDYYSSQKINDLSPLSNLTSVGGRLAIVANDITNLNGLSNLRSIGLTGSSGSLLIQSCYNLTNIDGLSNLTINNGSLSIINNPLLTNVNSLSNITAVRYLQIIANAALTNLDGLSNLTEVNGPRTHTCGCGAAWSSITSNPSLKNLDGLSDLTTIVGNFRIVNNVSLQNTTGLSNLSLAGGSLFIGSNPSLEDIGSFPDLSSVGGALVIEYHPLITNLDGFINLSSVGADLIIIGNTSLQSLEGFSNVSSVGAWLGVHNNASLQNVEGIHNVKYVGGAIEIINNDALRKIEGFNDLKFLGWSFRVIDNNSLTKIEGFQRLKSINGFFHILFNANLKKIEGFSKLSTAGHEVVFYENAALTNVDALSNLTTVWGWMVLQNLPSLKNIDGLSSLTRVGELTVAFCPLVQNIDGLSNLSSAGEIFLGYLPSLKNIDGLSSLTHVDGLLAVIEMAGLQNIDGLSNITYVGGDLWVFHNPFLTSCCGIYQLLCADSPACTTDAVGGFIDIGGNGAGCTEADIIAGCAPASAISLPGMEFQGGFPSVQIYPNPAREEMTIGLESLTTGSAQVKISNSLGTTLWQKQIDDVREVYQLTINLKAISSFESGLYFVTVLHGGEVYTRQAIIQQ